MQYQLKLGRSIFFVFLALVAVALYIVAPTAIANMVDSVIWEAYEILVSI